MYFTVRCDILPGKEEELDRLLGGPSRTFWLAQPGVKSFHVYGDTLVGWPERTIMIEVEDLASLQRILGTEERKRLRREFMNHTSNVSSQIQETII